MSLVEYWLLIRQHKPNLEHIVNVVSQDCKLLAIISHDYDMIAISDFPLRMAVYYLDVPISY